MGEQLPLESPTLRRLQRNLRKRGRNALKPFWNCVASTGTPLIEKRRGSPRDYWVTFLWRGRPGTQSVGLRSSLAGFVGAEGELTHLLGTDVWYRTYQVRDDLRLSYEFAVNETPGSEWDLPRLRRRLVDPLNPKILHYARDPKFPNPAMEILYGHSLLELPKAPRPPELSLRPGVEPGRLEEHLFRSRILKDERRIWVHIPFGVEPSRPDSHLAVFFDGWGYLHHISAPTILDNLVASRRIPPVLSVFIDQLGFWEKRVTDLCRLSPAFGRFLIQELLPWARRTYNVRLQSERTMLVGRSCGGLSALHWASEHPEHFRLVLSQSGWFQGGQPSNEEPGCLIRRLMSRPKLPLHVFLAAGLREGNYVWGGMTVLAANRHMRDVLRLKGYRLCYREFNGGHVPVCWPESLVEGLVELLGARRRGSERLR